MADTTPAGEAPGALEAVREVSIFLCYRRSDGSWFAEWLYKRLNDVEFRDSEGHPCRVRAYYDKTAPGVADWKALHFPSLQTARALLVICTPGIAKDFSRRGHPDWVYEELRWWVRRRESAPIVVDATGEGDRWLPELLTRKWPDINRIPLIQTEAESAVQAGDLEYEERVRERIVGAVRELEHRTLFEDLERSRRQEKRLKWALGAAMSLLALALLLSYYANERRMEAISQTHIAQERLRVAEGLLMRVLDPGQRGATSDRHLYELMNEALTRSHETQFVIVALDVLNCWNAPGSPSIMRIEVINRMLSKLDLINEEEVRSRIKMLRANLEADQKGTVRPHPCTVRGR